MRSIDERRSRRTGGVRCTRASSCPGQYADIPHRCDYRVRKTRRRKYRGWPGTIRSTSCTIFLAFPVILLHRITPFGLGLTSIASFVLLMFSPLLGMKALVPFGALMVFLCARLLLWEFRRPAFWVFLGTPMMVWLSSLVFFFFLEDPLSKWIVASAVSLLITLYAENCFTFYHLPSAYQATHSKIMVVYVLSAFFCERCLCQLFLLLPTWIPTLLVFFAVLFATTAVFWASKIGFGGTTVGDYWRDRHGGTLQRFRCCRRVSSRMLRFSVLLCVFVLLEQTSWSMTNACDSRDGRGVISPYSFDRTVVLI